MAAKKTVKKAAPKKAAPKKAAPKKAAPKKAAPKAAATGATAKKAAPKKKAAVKLTDKQRGMLQAVAAKGDNGHVAGKGEEATLKALATKKLLKTGKKDKETKKAPYVATVAGKKLAEAPAS